jgi:hypothetical protein
VGIPAACDMSWGIVSSEFRRSRFPPFANIGRKGGATCFSRAETWDLKGRGFSRAEYAVIVLRVISRRREITRARRELSRSTPRAFWVEQRFSASALHDDLPESLVIPTEAGLPAKQAILPSGGTCFSPACPRVRLWGGNLCETGCYCDSRRRRCSAHEIISLERKSSRNFRNTGIRPTRGATREPNRRCSVFLP